MRKLSTLYADALSILSQNYTLVWPFFGMLLVYGLIGQGLSEEVQPDLTLPWILYFVLILLIGIAFKAGLFAMSLEAVQYKRKVQAKEKAAAATGDNPEPALIDPFHSFTLLKSFLPGVGSFLGGFILGEFLQLLFLALLLLGLQWWVSTQPMLNATIDQINAFMIQSIRSGANEQVTSEQVQQFVMGLSKPEIRSLSMLGLAMFGSLVLYALFAFVTMLWPFIYIVREGATPPVSVWGAYGLSIRQVAYDPLRLTGMGLSKLLLILVGALLTVSGHAFFGVISQLLMLFGEVFFINLYFLYTLNFFQPISLTSSPDPSDSTLNPSP